MSNSFSPLIIDVLKRRTVGSKYDRLMDNQLMSRDELLKLQRDKLNVMVKHAIETVPYYKRKYGPYRKGMVISDVEPLTKAEVQKNPRDFVSESFDFSRLRTAKTSGSTGKPLVFYYDDNLRAWNRAATARALNWWGLNYGMRSMYVWGMPSDRIAAGKMHITYLLNNSICKNVFKMSTKEVNDFLPIVKQWRPVYIYGYTSGVYEMASVAIGSGRCREVNSAKLVITTSEMLQDYKRATIREGFGCQVAQEYGVGEVGIVGFECPRGHLHVYDDLVYIETTENGEALITSTVNKAMVLLRYNTGDLVVLEGKRTDCNLSFTVVEKLKGRKSEIINYRGRVLHSEVFDYIARELIAEEKRYIDDFKVTRVLDDKFMFYVTPGKDFIKDYVESKIHEFIRNVFGVSMQAEVISLQELPRSAAGKILFYSDERQKESKDEQS